MDSIYKLRDCIEAHDNDVKSVFTLSNGYGFISASRDLTVRLWKEEFETFKQENKFSFHKNYISAVIYMNPCLRYSDGIILSTGYDKIIHGYSPLSCEIEFSLTGHTDTVTSLSVNGMDLVSGSMDKTAIIWDLSTNSISGILKGHNHGIWSVVLLQCVEHGLLTASADKEIFLWDTKSQTKIRQFSGHTDCVRNVIEIPERKQFLSCSNDATIRLWSLKNSKCLCEFHGHSTYIYSMSTMSDGNSFVSCGEDGMLCVWDMNKPAKPLQTIIHCAESVWCVSVLNNGDIVTGASDGRIRLFSKNPSLQNGIELAAIKSSEAVNDQLIAELPSVGIEILSLPGGYDGQLVKVSDEGTQVLYSWSVIKDMWLKQKVIDNSLKSTVKKTHDYEFSIDIKDGEPPLKLQYNNGEDPWIVAHKFLEENDVSPMFLDQVANFIIKNTNQKEVPIVQVSEFSDPFTGSNRYVPDMSPQPVLPTKMFPQKAYVRFDQINCAGLSKKIVEIAGSSAVPDDILALIGNLNTIPNKDCPKLSRWVIERIFDWDTEVLFPLIDILRMLVREAGSNELCFSNGDLVVKLLSRTLGCPDQCSKGNMLTMVKFLANGFSHNAGEILMMRMFAEIGDNLIRSVSVTEDKATLSAISSWFLNMSVLINGRHDDSRRTQLLELCFQALERVSVDSVHRVLVTIGTLVCDSDSFTFRDKLTIGVLERINTLSKLYQDRAKYTLEVVQCSEQLEQLVSSLELINF